MGSSPQCALASISPSSASAITPCFSTIVCHAGIDRAIEDAVGGEMIAACELLVEFLSAVPSIPAVVSGENALTLCANDRDRGTPRGAAPPTPPGIRVAYLGGSTGLSFNSQCRDGAGRES